MNIKILIYYTESTLEKGKQIFNYIVKSLADNDKDNRENIFSNDIFEIRLLRFDEIDNDKADLIYYPKSIINGNDYNERYENMLALSRSKRESIIPY